MTTTSQTPTKAPVYENNPFFVAVNGLELLFKKAQAIGIVFAVLMALSAISTLPGAFMPGNDAPMSETQITAEEKALTDGLSAIPAELWLLIAAVAVTILLVFIVIGIVINGVADYTAAQLSHDKEVGFSEALRAVFANFWGYVWVIIVMGIKIFLWSLLLIVPGFIMAVRYSLTGTVFFDKKLKGNAASVESARMTKGVWLTTFASHALLNMITLGIIELLLVPGTRAVLYGQYLAYDQAKVVKPKAHVLSWLTLIIPVLLFVVIILAALLLLASIANYYGSR